MSKSPDYSQISKIAQSTAGQQLIAFLQKNGGQALQNAIEKAASGDYADAKQAISTLLSTREAQLLIKQLEDKK